MSRPDQAVRRLRFAPSPTGALHLGGIRTALFNWLVARSTDGAFVLRIEDTDQGRYIAGSEQQILDSLRWLGLRWDEGPDVGGPHAPYVQSLRTQRYRDVGDELAARGSAYWCDCTRERLEALRAEQQRNRQPPRYDRRCLTRQAEVLANHAAGMPVVLRERIPEGSVSWDDAIRGRIEWDYAEVDDQVLLKSDGFPTYHLANIVDDHDMEITDVVRAEEWIPSTPKHLALYAALEWSPPRFAHVPLVLGPDKQKLSKRRGAPDVLAYRDQGYLPAAVVNAMALLGWSPPDGKEVLTPGELVGRFSLERVQSSPAVYDPKRLDALNGQHIRLLRPGELADALEPWLPELDRDRRLELVPLLQERLPRLDAAHALASPLVSDPDWPQDIPWPPEKVDATTARVLLEATIADVEGGGLDDVDALRERLTAFLDERGVKARVGFLALYVAILRSPQGVPVFAAMHFIGRARTLARLREGVALLPAAQHAP